jgi:uncharacterized protein YjbJ (UPF0337 family)
MSGKMDEVKGRIKEAVGALTDDDKLRQAGLADQTSGKIKQSIQKAVDTVKGALENAVDKTKESAP